MWAGSTLAELGSGQAEALHTDASSDAGCPARSAQLWAGPVASVSLGFLTHK